MSIDRDMLNATRITVENAVRAAVSMRAFDFPYSCTWWKPGFGALNGHVESAVHELVRFACYFTRAPDRRSDGLP